MSDIAIPVPNLGVMAHLDRRDVPPRGLAQAENWIFKNGEFQVRPGLATFGDNVAQRPMGYIQYRHSDGALRTVKGTRTGLWKYNSSTNTWTNITGAALTGGPTQQVVFRVFQKAGATHLLEINEADVLQKWDGNAAAFSAAGGGPPRARCMAINARRVILGNLQTGGTISPVAVDVSASSDFESGWGTTQTELLSDTPGDIIGMSEHGNLLTAIYKSDAIYKAVAVGAVDPFEFPLALALDEKSGPASTLGIVKLSEGIDAYLGNDGSPRIYDGASRPVEFSPAASRWIKDNADFSVLRRSFGFYDPLLKLLYFVFAEVNKSNPNLVAVIDPRNGIFHPYRYDTLRLSAGIMLNASTGLTIAELVGTLADQELTFAEYETIQPRIILGEIGGQSYKDSATTDNAVAITTFWEGGLQPLGGNPRKFKTVKYVDHEFTKAAAAQAVTVKLGKSQYGEDPVLTAGKTLAIGNAGPYRTGHAKTARKISVRMEANATQAIKYKGSVAVVEERGFR